MSSLKILSLSLAIAFSCLGVATAQWEQVGTPIPGEATPAFFGGSVAVSGDGQFMAASQPFRQTNDSAGLPNDIIVYDRFNGDWREIDRIQTEFPDTFDDEFGSSLEFTHDGSRLVIGTPNIELFDASLTNLGRAEVFQRQSDNTFSQLGGDILNTAGGVTFGSAVSISDDGNTIAVGRPVKNVVTRENTGLVQTFRFDGSDWQQIGQTLGDNPATDQFYGSPSRVP